MTELQCRFCKSEISETFCDLGMSPVSNAFVSVEHANIMEPYYPLHAFVCDQCWLVQLGEFQTPEEIFDEHYAYFSSFSESWLEHSRQYVDDVTRRFSLNENSLVVEIASNDGYLLQYFVRRGIPVLGIEPTANTARVAEEKGVTSWVKFFGQQTASELVAQSKRPDLLLGNNVLAHVPDINDFVGGMKTALAARGVITMEFPHLLNLIEFNQFDTIYHEHFSYLSLMSVESLFSHHGLTIFDVKELPTHGGSLRIFARHEGDQTKPILESVKQLRERELAVGLNKLESYRAFGDVVNQVKRDLLKFLIAQKEAGKTVVGYGAPAKGNTLLNYCGIRTDLINYTTDRNPHKQGRLLPGVHIPIEAPEKILETKPDFVLILPWNLRDEIVEQLRYIRDWNGQFVVAIPALEIF